MLLHDASNKSVRDAQRSDEEVSRRLDWVAIIPRAPFTPVTLLRMPRAGESCNAAVMDHWSVETNSAESPTGRITHTHTHIGTSCRAAPAARKKNEQVPLSAVVSRTDEAHPTSRYKIALRSFVRSLHCIGQFSPGNFRFPCPIYNGEKNNIRLY